MDFYYNPAKYGMRTVGEIDWSSGSYEFDLTTVWQKEDGSFVYGEDSGCSCPTPYEDMNAQDLVKIESLNEFKEFLYGHNYSQDTTMDIVNLLDKLHAAGLR